MNTISRTSIALQSAITAFINPSRQDMVAALGETTGELVLRRMRDRMLTDRNGRRILRERPRITSESLDLKRLESLDENSLGRHYLQFLRSCKVTPDSRTPVKYLEDDEISYVMQRYREVHDFWHALSGIGVTVEEELALKCWEFVHCGLPVALLSTAVGPLRLTHPERTRLFSVYVPWAIQSASTCAYLMNVPYEDLLHVPIDDLRSELNYLPFVKS